MKKEISRDVSRWWKFWPTHERLQAEIDALRVELSHRLEGDALERSNNLLEVAQARARKGLLISGWTSLHSAQRMLFDVMDARELQDHAAILLAECRSTEKVNYWRTQAIQALLEGPLARLDSEDRTKLITRLAKKAREGGGSTSENWPDVITAIVEKLGGKFSDVERKEIETALGRATDEISDELLDRLISKVKKTAPEGTVEPGEGLSASTVRLATWIRDENSGNVHFKTTHTRGLLIGLQVVMITTTLAFFFVSKMEYDYLTGAAADLARDRTVWCVVLMGTLGGAFSAIRNVSALAASNRSIPLQVRDGIITVCRPALGAVGALVVLLFINSGILNIGKSLGVAALLAISFVAGYTERLVLRGVESVAGKAKE